MNPLAVVGHTLQFGLLPINVAAGIVRFAEIANKKRRPESSLVVVVDRRQYL
jgi:hypothetical protein